ncbi:MAG: HAMP domain-containing protein, partial [Deltaproteobacteria bacterium]|nr:HAMP domain-containing protein [Deltaproteobacteria bacterium]
RSKFFVITAMATIVPVVAAALLGRAWVDRVSRGDFERLLADGDKEVRRQYRDLQADVAKAVERLADPEDHFIGPLLIALAKGGPDDDLFRQLPATSPRVMRERGLDVLTVLGPRRRVLASGHFPGRIGDTEARWPVGAREASPHGRAILVDERVVLSGHPSTQLTVEVWRQATSPLGPRVWVSGGRFIDRRFVRRLRFREDTKVLIRDARGKTIVAPKGGGRRHASTPRRVTKLLGPKGKVVATVTLAVSDARLKSTLEVINIVAAGAVLGGLLLALLMGALVRPITRPLERLVVAAEAVAAGDLEHRIPARGRGDEVGELVDSFNRMTTEIQESKARLVAAERVAAWREIARRIAHEIKNPLFPIQTSIETLRKVHGMKHPDFEEIFAESTTTILEEVARMKHIVTEFSNFARMPKPSVDAFEVDEWLCSTVSLYAGEGASVRCYADEGLVLMGDRDQLTQVVANLVKNAADACASHGGEAPATIDVEARHRGEGDGTDGTDGDDERVGTVEIVVEDNGPGFDATTAAQIFTPYFTTKKAQGGTGLGLAICHRIVTDHGGTIEAHGEEGHGARFLIRLPLAGPPK